MRDFNASWPSHDDRKHVNYPRDTHVEIETGSHTLFGLGMGFRKREKQKSRVKYGILKVCTRKTSLDLVVHHTNSKRQKREQITGKYPYKNAGEEGEVWRGAGSKYKTMSQASRGNGMGDSFGRLAEVVSMTQIAAQQTAQKSRVSRSSVKG
ncbi:hypothetical protein BJV78DRAFT_12864 [Lactifluus subvellereus]|nr:hypothetical protein BJV78DRAFT_12864 [Lactifluus subvellereus]